MSGSLRRSVATILFATTLAACGGSQSVTDPASTARACGAGPDFRASSLPGDSTPRPGPEILYAPAPPAPQLQNTGVWQAAPILVSGATAYRCGEFLYQDWLFDDRGAAGAPDPADPFSPVSYLFSPKAGTLTYPTDPVFANNAADLVELRMRLLPDATASRITLNTLQDAERTAFTIALGDSTGAREWPFGAGVSSPARERPPGLGCFAPRRSVPRASPPVRPRARSGPRTVMSASAPTAPANTVRRDCGGNQTGERA